jgi:hypothetical protein
MLAKFSFCSFFHGVGHLQRQMVMMMWWYAARYWESLVSVRQLSLWTMRSCLVLSATSSLLAQALTLVLLVSSCCKLLVLLPLLLVGLCTTERWVFCYFFEK